MKIQYIKWLSGLFLLCLSFSGWSQTIVKAEYFFNTDPGVGKGKSLSVTTSGQVDGEAEISTEGLEDGFHTLYIRFRDQQGSWSMSEGRTFLIQPPPQPPAIPTIAKAEYFIDTDPGAGRGKEIPLTANGQVDELAELNTDGGISLGFHNLYIRTMDNTGKWSLTEGRPFFVDKTLNLLATIVAAEYYFDDKNPTPGKGIPLDIEQGTQLEIEKQIDISGLALGEHRLNLRLQDSKGAWSYNEIKEFTVATPRIDAITPVSGGNVGDVTVNILGASFDEGTKVKLTRAGQPDIVVPDSLISLFNGEQLQIVLDLRERATGDYNVVATLGDGTSLTVPNGFLVLEGVKADPWVEIIGFDRIRRGQWQTYTITYGNRGNVNATGVPLWIQIPVDSEYELDFELYKPEDNTIMWDTIPISYVADTIHGNPEKARIIPLVVASMAPNEIGTLTFKLKTDATDNFVISAWVSRPLYQSPISNEAIDCISDAIGTSLSLLPGAGCVHSLLDIGVKPLIKQLYNNDNGLYDSEGTFKAGSFFANAAFTLAGCIPGAKLATSTAKVLDTVSKIGSTNSAVNTGGCAGSLIPPDWPKKNKPIRPVASFDPNDKLGLEGAGPKKYIQGTEVFPYLIRFENKASATAAAQTVRIVDTLDTNTLDISTLQLGFFSFDDVIVNIPPGRKNYSVDVDLRPKNDLIVRIEAKLDEEKGILTWWYTSLDPRTLRTTENPDAGFLSPNKTAPQGEGGVFYTIKPRADLATNVQIENKAYIFFDNNEVIPTPTWSNSIDKLPPASQVASLPEIQTDSTFTVRWSGNDEGAGISNYSIYVSVNNQPYTLWLNKITDSSSLFEGKPDSSYQFYSIAQDSTRILEEVPNIADAFTTITDITGIEEELENEILVYPNPASHTLTVELPSQLIKSNLRLTNIFGAVLLKMEAVNHTTVISVNYLPQGLYLLRISNEDFTTTKKILIK